MKQTHILIIEAISSMHGLAYYHMFKSQRHIATLLRKPCLCFYARDRKFIFKYLLDFLFQGEDGSPM